MPSKKIQRQAEDFFAKIKRETNISSQKLDKVKKYLEFEIEFAENNIATLPQYQLLEYIMGFREDFPKFEIDVKKNKASLNVFFLDISKFVRMLTPNIHEWDIIDERIMKLCIENWKDISKITTKYIVKGEKIKLTDTGVAQEIVYEMAYPINEGIRAQKEEDTYHLLKGKLQEFNFSDEEYDEMAFKYFCFLNDEEKPTSFGRYFLSKPFDKFLTEFENIGSFDDYFDDYTRLLSKGDPAVLDSNLDKIKAVFLKKYKKDENRQNELFEFIFILLDSDAVKYEKIIMELIPLITDTWYRYLTVLYLTKFYNQKYLQLATEYALSVLDSDDNSSGIIPSTIGGLTKEKYKSFNIKFRLAEWLMVNYGVEAKQWLKKCEPENEKVRLQYFALIEELLGKDAVDILVNDGILAKFDYEERDRLVNYKKYYKTIFELIAAYDLSEYVPAIQEHFSKEKNTHILKMLDKYLKDKNIAKPKGAKKEKKSFIQQRELFDTFSKKQAEVCLKTIVKAKNELNAPICHIKFIHNHELFYKIITIVIETTEAKDTDEPFYEIELEFSKDEMEADYRRFNLEYSEDLGLEIDEDFEMPKFPLQEFKKKHGYDKDDKDFERCDSYSMVYHIIFYCMMNSFINLPKALKKEGIAITSDMEMGFAKHEDWDDPLKIETETLEEYEDHIADGISEVFIDKNTLEEFAYICFESPAMQKWMLKMFEEE